MFFEGVEAKVATGVKEEEVGYQLAYSKAELRKVIKEYPGKEVKKNLEHLYKKVEKQMCEEENLLQVRKLSKLGEHFLSLQCKDGGRGEGSRPLSCKNRN